MYGAGREFRVSEDCERPINVYAFSKLMFDRFVRRSLAGVAGQSIRRLEPPA